jgi:hypothetical protein
MVIQNPEAKPTKRSGPEKRELSSAERIAAIGARIPDEELASIPTDAARNLDHYLYGAPKQD